jgi:hypothetical protein
MKRLFVLALAVVMIAAFAVPASALENKFGGYMETNLNTYKGLNYQDNNSSDYSTIRSRTRLYYTAILSEKLKFINKFEMDTEYGAQSSGYGDLGADGVAVEVKNSYLDFTTANLRFEVGTQNFNVLRGLLVNDDASGFKVSYRGADNFIPAFWMFRLNNGDKESGNDGEDTDQYTGLVNIKMNNMQIVPSISYLYANSGAYAGGTAGEALGIYILGIDFNMKTDMFDIVAAAGYEGGSIDDTTDIAAYMFNLKAKLKMGKFGIRGEVLYTTGEEVDSLGNTSGDFDGWTYPEQNSTGANYSTAEFYRKGKDWTKVPNGPAAPGYNNAPNGNAVENRMEFGLGVDFAISKAWKVSFDWWNLNLAEDAANGNKDVGNELDLVATWGIMKNLNLDLIGAYLIVGDAIKPVTNDENAYELSSRLRLSF